MAGTAGVAMANYNTGFFIYSSSTLSLSSLTSYYECIITIELVKCLEDLRDKRDALNKTVTSKCIQTQLLAGYAASFVIAHVALLAYHPTSMIIEVMRVNRFSVKRRRKRRYRSEYKSYKKKYRHHHHHYWLS